MISQLLSYVIFLNVSSSFLFFVLFICFRVIFLYSTENPTMEDDSNKSTNNVPTPIYPQKIKVPLSEEKRPSPQHLSKLVNKNILLNLNIAYFFKYISLTICIDMVHHRWTYKKIIKHLGLTRRHQKTVEITWHMVNKCKEMEQ